MIQDKLSWRSQKEITYFGESSALVCIGLCPPFVKWQFFGGASHTHSWTSGDAERASLIFRIACLCALNRKERGGGGHLTQTLIHWWPDWHVIPSGIAPKPLPHISNANAAKCEGTFIIYHNNLTWSTTDQQNIVQEYIQSFRIGLLSNSIWIYHPLKSRAQLFRKGLMLWWNYFIMKLADL